MSKIFFLGFFMLVASTIAFIIAILTPFWIIKSNPWYRGIFQVCDRLNPTDNSLLQCAYILTYSDSTYVQNNRSGNLNHFYNIYIQFDTIQIIWSIM